MSKKNSPDLPPGTVDLVGLGAPLQPQVNLLPPEIRARRSLGRLKMWLGVALLAVLVVAAGGVVWAMSVENRANEQRQAVQDDIAEILAEQAKYSEVPTIKRALADTVAARDLVMSTEVLWAEFLGSIQATIPANVRLIDMTTSLPGPFSAETPSSNPLDPPAVGAVVFNGRASVLPDLADWMDRLAIIPGVVGVSFESADLMDDEGVIGYDISVTVQVDATVQSHRFAAEEGE